MKKVAIVSLTPDLIKKDVVKTGFKIVENNPDFVISYGGDGTNLIAEAKYSGVPRVLIKNSKICYKCENGCNINKILKLIKKGKFRIVKEDKLEAFVKNKKLLALNEINIHYKMPHALRFNVKVNGKIICNECIGDGLVIATPHGSTGYYHSITGKHFARGIGLAFNNPMKINGNKFKNLILNSNSNIIIQILRGPGYLTNDGNENLISLNKGDIIKIKKAKQYSKIIKFN